MLSKEYCRDLVEQLKDLPIIPIYLVNYAYLVATLQKNGGNKSKTAREIKVSVRTIRNKIKELEYYGFEIPPPKIGTPKSSCTIPSSSD